MIWGKLDLTFKTLLKIGSWKFVFLVHVPGTLFVSVSVLHKSW